MYLQRHRGIAINRDKDSLVFSVPPATDPFLTVTEGRGGQ